MTAGLTSVCNSDLPACSGNAASLPLNPCSTEQQAALWWCSAQLSAGHAAVSVTAAKVVLQVPDPVSHTAEAMIFLRGVACLLPVTPLPAVLCPTSVCSAEDRGFSPDTTPLQKWPDWVCFGFFFCFVFYSYPHPVRLLPAC